MPEAPLRLKVLASRYPRLFPSSNVLESVSIPQGWLNLFDLLCARIDTILEDNPEAVIEVLQVKDKFAELRFYFRQTGGDINVVKEIRESVALAAAVSKRCCEKCGGPGEIMNDQGWMRVRCQQCD